MSEMKKTAKTDLLSTNKSRPIGPTDMKGVGLLDDIHTHAGISLVLDDVVCFQHSTTL